MKLLSLFCLLALLPHFAFCAGVVTDGNEFAMVILGLLTALYVLVTQLPRFLKFIFPETFSRKTRTFFDEK